MQDTKFIFMNVRVQSRKTRAKSNLQEKVEVARVRWAASSRAPGSYPHWAASGGWKVAVLERARAGRRAQACRASTWAVDPPAWAMAGDAG